MPEEINGIEILRRVLRKTQEAKLGWQKTADENTFICVVEGDYTFSIRRFDYEGETRIAFWMTDNENEEVFRLSGSYEPAFQPRSLGQMFDADKAYSPELTQLYDSARSLALDVKRKLREAAAVLDRI